MSPRGDRALLMVLGTPCLTASWGQSRVELQPGTEPSLTPKRRLQRRLCCLQEQAELKIRTSELRAKEDQLAAEREALERERQELRLEKERINAAALRIRLRAEEVDRLSQVPGSSAQGAWPAHEQCPDPSQPH